jgi:DNA-binding GntR family transcriptional regulator
MAAVVSRMIPRLPLIDEVYGSLREGIVRGEYLPGTHLVEANLTRAYGVSRSTIREALRRLHADDLVEVVPHRGATVRRLSLEDVMDLYTVREPIEALAARLAAAAPADAAEQLSSIHEDAEVAVAANDRLRFTRANARLHRAIADMAGNRPLTIVLARLNTQIIGYQFASVANAINFERAHREHGEVLAAIFARDPDAAERAMRRHLRSTRDSIVGAATQRRPG